MTSSFQTPRPALRPRAISSLGHQADGSGRVPSFPVGRALEPLRGGGTDQDGAAGPAGAPGRGRGLLWGQRPGARGWIRDSTGDTPGQGAASPHRAPSRQRARTPARTPGGAPHAPRHGPRKLEGAGRTRRGSGVGGDPRGTVLCREACRTFCSLGQSDSKRDGEEAPTSLRRTGLGVLMGQGRGRFPTIVRKGAGAWRGAARLAWEPGGLAHSGLRTQRTGRGPRRGQTDGPRQSAS